MNQLLIRLHFKFFLEIHHFKYRKHGKFVSVNTFIRILNPVQNFMTLSVDMIKNTNSIDKALIICHPT